MASGRCSPISTNHVALFGLSCTRLGLVSTLHLALAIFQQGAPCFGHCPKKNMCVFKAGTTVCRISICVRESSTSLQHIRVAWMGQDYTWENTPSVATLHIASLHKICYLFPRYRVSSPVIDGVSTPRLAVLLSHLRPLFACILGPQGRARSCRWASSRRGEYLW